MKDKVNFKVIGQDNKILSTHNKADCYAAITYHSLNKDISCIVLYHLIIDTPYTVEEIQQWIEAMNSWGFPIEYIGKGHIQYDINDNYHVWMIPIKEDKQVYYTDKTQLTSALTLARYLMEDLINELPKQYFKLLSELPPDVNTFFVMQMAHIGLDGNSNHTLREFRPESFITLEEFKERSEKQQCSIYAAKEARINHLWKGTRKHINGTTMEKYQTLSGVGKVATNKVYVVGGDVNYMNWFPDSESTDDIKKANVVLFTGGEDVDPRMYNEPKNHRTYSNIRRDNEEQKIFLQAKELGLKMVGICRGSQFLCVMNGGRLIQHQNNPDYIHKILLDNGKAINITSTHHQAAYPFNLRRYDYKILGWTEKASSIHLDGLDNELAPPKECEIVYYRDTMSLGIQGHPEDNKYQRDNPDSMMELTNILNKYILNV